MNPVSATRYGGSHGGDHEEAVLWDVTVRGQVTDVSEELVCGYFLLRWRQCIPPKYW